MLWREISLLRVEAFSASGSSISISGSASATSGLVKLKLSTDGVGGVLVGVGVTGDWVTSDGVGDGVVLGVTRPIRFMHLHWAFLETFVTWAV